MPQTSVLRWLDGRGWLVLSGGHDTGSEIRAQAIGRISADGGAAYITLGSASTFGEQALADMDDLGAPTGYLVDVLSEDDDTLRQKLAEASLVVIEEGATPGELRSALLGAANEGILRAYENGAVILAEGSAAGVFGMWLMLESQKILSGLGWLENSFIMPGVKSVSDSQTGQAALKAYPEAVSLGIGFGSALVLGPDGEVETWGNKQIIVTLGPNAANR